MAFKNVCNNLDACVQTYVLILCCSAAVVLFILNIVTFGKVEMGTKSEGITL